MRGLIERANLESVERLNDLGAGGEGGGCCCKRG